MTDLGGCSSRECARVFIVVRDSNKEPLNNEHVCLPCLNISYRRKRHAYERWKESSPPQAPTTNDPLTQLPRAKEVQFNVSEPQSLSQDEAAAFAASLSPTTLPFERELDTTSPALGLLPPTDQDLCPRTAETCKGTKPKESSPPQERYDMPPTDQDLFSAYFDDDLFDDG